jgi:HD-GYP domain-containing protein (c-di-GMP phosphodiesterase class II)
MEEKTPINFINCLPGTSISNMKIQEWAGPDIHFTAFSENSDFNNLLHSDKLNILLLNRRQFNQFPTDVTSYFRIRFLLHAAQDEISNDLMVYDLIQDWFTDIPGERELAFALLRAKMDFVKRNELSRLQKQVLTNRKNLSELNRIGASLNSEHEIDKLLDLILEKCMEITSSDAGSLYLVVEEERVLAQADNAQKEKKLQFKITKNMSREVAFTEFTMDINNKSISGSVAATGEILNIEDVHHLPANSTFGWNKSLDEASGYRTKSMLTVPMKNSHDEVIGVVQLINKKANPRIKLIEERDFGKYVRSYNRQDESLALSLAAQAAVAVDNARLYQDITNLFEGFIRASVTAIETRDPTTSGHSERVSVLSAGMAKAVNEVSEGPLAKIHFSDTQLNEIKYAGLLHDFGKIGVSENVLVKAKKLYPHELNVIRARFEYIKKCVEMEYTKKKNDLLLAYGNKVAKEHMDNLETEMRRRMDEINNFFNFILKANEPAVLTEGTFDRIQEIGQTVFNHQGERIELLSPQEIQRLSIKRGSLSEDERIEIETHVTHTFKFLSKIPWTDDLKNVSAIAYAHHEKLDGSGYPRQIKGPEILVQSKIMAIADIFDALTASDRPYKKAMPVDKALEIIEDEVKYDKLDKAIFDVFVKKQIYKSVI